MNFSDIMRTCKENYRPFTATVPVTRRPVNLIDTILQARQEGRRPVIAEIKPASPTEGAIRTVPDPAGLAGAYRAGGACAVSVLTEPRFFGGSMELLRQAAGSGLPVLRKDFLFDPAQVRESYFYGADSLLLIASFFDVEQLAAMVAECRAYGIEPLVEVHDEADIGRAREAGARLYGINNRDRDTLRVDLGRTARLAPKIDGVKVSASGISSPAALTEALRCCDAALVGTALMRAADPEAALRELVYGDVTC